jgi:hypothetical protein
VQPTPVVAVQDLVGEQPTVAFGGHAAVWFVRKRHRDPIGVCRRAAARQRLFVGAQHKGIVDCLFGAAKRGLAEDNPELLFIAAVKSSGGASLSTAVPLSAACATSAAAR